MITDINGNPYTTAQDDLQIQKVKHALYEVLRSEVQGTMLTSRGAEIQIDVRPVFTCFEIAYALGRAREYCKRPPTKTERQRVNEFMQKAVDLLNENLTHALDNTHAGRAELLIEPVLVLVDQIYYAGREDGAGR